MKKIHLYITLLFSLSFTLRLNAQTREEQSNMKCKHCMHGEHTNESPYTMNLKSELPFLGTAAAFLTSGLIIKSINEEAPFTLNELDQLDPSKINSFDRGAVNNNSASARQLSNYTLAAGALLPLYFLGNNHTRSDFFPLILMGAEVFSITSSLTLNSKYMFNRTRPLTYNSSFSNELRTGATSKLSFFSGHTAQTAGLSFFMAKVITDYHPNMRTAAKVGIWSFAVALPAATGYFRIKGGKHFNSDVITGFAVGAVIGWLVPQLHKKKESKLSLNYYNHQGANGLSFKLALN